MKCFSVPAVDQLWQLREKAQKKVMEVGGDVSNGLLSVKTKPRQTGGEREREREREREEMEPPSFQKHTHRYTRTHTHTHTFTCSPIHTLGHTHTCPILRLLTL